MNERKTGLDAFTSEQSNHDPPADMDPENGQELQQMIRSIQTLQSRYRWKPDQPSAQRVVQECRERDLEVDEVLETMDDARGSGWERWQWVVGQLDAYTGPGTT